MLQQSAQVRFRQALQLHGAGRRADAAQACQHLLIEFPQFDDAAHLLAVIDIEEGRIDGGVTRLERLMQRQPDNVQIRFTLGRALAARGDTDAAITQFQDVVRRAPAPEPRLELAKLLLDRNDRDGAIAAAVAALSAAAGNPAIQVNAGSLLALAGATARARGVLTAAVAGPAQRHPLAHFNLAKALAAEPDPEPEKALDHYRRALALKPDLAAAWHNLGNLLLDLDRPEEAAEAYQQRVILRRGAKARPADDAGHTTASKLIHDIEQFQYLIEQGRLPTGHIEVVDAYDAALSALPKPPAGKSVVEIPPAMRPRLAPTYNRLIHWEPPAALDGPAVNPALDTQAIEADYAANAPGMTHVDGLLVPEALERLRRFCLESTIWYGYRYANGYVGAFIDDGFCCPLLIQIAQELRQALPGVIGTHELRKLWAFKYDSELSGIPLHADFAAVNVNFWVTPDEANKDPESGGLTVYDKEAPLDWGFEKFNADEAAMRQFLADNGAGVYHAPYRQNRMVIFNSDLFHETGPLRFKPGYENRRINITMLYGRRG